MFYVDIDNKKFIPPPSSDSLQRPPSGCSFPPSCPPPARSWESLCEPYKILPAHVKKPVLIHTQIVEIPFTLVHEDYTPVDITDMTFVLAVDDNFNHQDQLIAFSQDFTIEDPLNGIVTFRADCSSVKFQEVLKQHVPASMIMMQLVQYPSGSPDGTAILQDRGIQMRPRVYAWEGAPDPAAPHYYTKSQVNALLQGYIPGISDSSAGRLFNGHGEPDPEDCSPGDVYMNLDDQGIWIKSQTQWVFFGYIADSKLDLTYDIITD